MPYLFVYLIKVNIALLLFCLGYYAVLRRLTFYTLNRVYLICALLFSTLYPFIDFSAFLTRHEQLAQPIQTVVINWQVPVIHVVQTVKHDNWFWLAAAFWFGVALMAARLLIQLLSLYKLHRRSRQASVNNYTIRTINENINPFSFWQSIYVNPENHPPAELSSILEHEQIHVKEWHTLDILLSELSIVFYWFNPGVWLIKKAIRENIEFITDQKILLQGVDCKAYQYSLLNVTFNSGSNPIVNHFNISTIKKRIIMMNSERSSRINLTRYAFLVPVVLILVMIFSVSKAGLRKRISKESASITKAIKSTVGGINAAVVNVLPATIINATPLKPLKLGRLNADTTRGSLSATMDTTVKIAGSGINDAVIYIDGVLSKNGLKDIDANSIASMSVYKNYSDKSDPVNTKGIISIVTKGNEDSPAVKAFEEKISKKYKHNDGDLYNKKVGAFKDGTPVFIASGSTTSITGVKINGDTFTATSSGNNPITKVRINGQTFISPSTNYNSHPDVFTDANGIGNIVIGRDTVRYNSVNAKPGSKYTSKDVDIYFKALKTKNKNGVIVYGDSIVYKKGSDPVILKSANGMVIYTDTLVYKKRVDPIRIRDNKGVIIYSDSIVYKKGADPIRIRNFGSTYTYNPVNPTITHVSTKLFIIDGKVATEKQRKKLSANDIETISTLNGNAAENLYGDKGKNGVIVITTKK